MTSVRPAASASLTDHLRHWARHRPQQRAFSHVDFPDSAPMGVHRALGWRALDARARAVADRLVQVAAPGERAALVLPQGLDYAAGFLGCLYARVIAVPLFGPQLPGHEGKLAAVLADCEPACLLSDSETAPPTSSTPPAPPALRPAWRSPTPTSSPTPARRLPLTVADADAGDLRGLAAALPRHGARAERRGARRTGLAVGAHGPGRVPARTGALATRCWPRIRRALSAAPNFAYDYCVARTDPGLVDELRLDRVAGSSTAANRCAPGRWTASTRHSGPPGSTRPSTVPRTGSRKPPCS
jgi:acyl-CoA synthetase (AMP-forming)/AMP-acid ligase II